MQVQAEQLEKALREAEGAAEHLQDMADAAEDALAEARGDLARQTATNKTLLTKLASSRVSGQPPVRSLCEISGLSMKARYKKPDVQRLHQHTGEACILAICTA